MLVSIKELRKYLVSGRDGQALGPLSDVFLDERTWQARYLVVEAAAWLSRRVPLHPLAVRSCDPEGRSITVDVGRGQIESAPPLNADEPISQHQAEQYYRHFAWPAYWPPSGLGFQRASASSSAYQARPSTGANGPYGADPHLREALAFEDLEVQASGQPAGRVDDQLVDTSTWIIEYLVVNVQPRWFPRRVLIAPRRIQGIDWVADQVHLGLDRDEVRGSPLWSPATLVDHYYEARLARPHGWPFPP
jgi:hypothetical protein